MHRIRFLRHNDIDQDRWDRCIAEAVNRRLYAFSWYLNIVCPGWCALVDEDYRSVFPLTSRRKAGIGYLFQPFFTQQLGLFSVEHLTPDMLDTYLSEVRSRYRFAEIQLNSMNRPDPSKWNVTWRKNHELDLIRGYEQLRMEYPKNTIRNLKKGRDNEIEIQRKIGPDELISLFRHGRGNREGKLKYDHYEQIRRIMQHVTNNGQGYIAGAFAQKSRLDAAGCFVHDDNRIYFLFAASALGARETGAMFLLIDHTISSFSGKPLILDFEGGNDPDLGRFYRGFGAIESHYPMIYINRLPRFLLRLKKSTFVQTVEKK